MNASLIATSYPVLKRVPSHTSLVPLTLICLLVVPIILLRDLTGALFYKMIDVFEGRDFLIYSCIPLQCSIAGDKNQQKLVLHKGLEFEVLKPNIPNSLFSLGVPLGVTFFLHLALRPA